MAAVRLISSRRRHRDGREAFAFPKWPVRCYRVAGPARFRGSGSDVGLKLPWNPLRLYAFLLLAAFGPEAGQSCMHVRIKRDDTWWEALDWDVPFLEADA